MTRRGSRTARRPRASRRWRWGMVLGGMAVVAVCVTIRSYWGADQADAQLAGGPAAAQPPAASAAKKELKTVAAVNGEEITREDLARECLWHYGKDVLESMVNKRLIARECARHGITVTQEEVSAEITRLSSRFNLPVDRWMKMIEQERGISPAQYEGDIIWPTLALRKLAGREVEVTPEELKREFETQNGPMVQVRLIMCSSKEKAERVHALATANPDQFGALAKQHSEDVNSASAEGLIQPIRKHVGYKEVEEAAFRLQPGQISPVLKVGNQHIILKCERHIAGRDERDLQYVAKQLEEAIRDQKLRNAASGIFRKLQDAAKVDVFFGDKARRDQAPGVAAVIQGPAGAEQISLRELAEECITRHGADVLEGTINRRLIEQACKKRNIVVTEADMDEEIARAAALVLPPMPDGSPDVKEYLKQATGEQNVPLEIFRRDSIWPSVALRKLVGKVEVSEEDIERGFQANFGPRVRCRAIVMNDMRRAQEVWDKARSRPTADFFGELARQYSVDAASGSMGGQIPPVKRFGGQPALETQAFELAPGEISGIFQLDGKYVILFCEGRTDPLQVSKEEVRKELHDDIYEKKLRIAMAKYFQNLQDTATIDNYLAGTVRQPKKQTTPAPAASGVRPAGYVPPVRQGPAARK